MLNNERLQAENHYVQLTMRIVQQIDTFQRERDKNKSRECFARNVCFYFQSLGDTLSKTEPDFIIFSQLQLYAKLKMHLESRLGNDDRNWVELGQVLLSLSDVLHSHLATEFKTFYDALTVMVGSGTKCHCTYAPQKHNMHSCKWAQAIASYHRRPSKIAWWVSDNSKWGDSVSGPTEIARLYSGKKSVNGLRYLQLLRWCSFFNVSERTLGDVIDVWKNVWGNTPSRSLSQEDKLRAFDAVTKVLLESSFRGDPNTKKVFKEIQSIGFWDHPKLQAAEIKVMRNYRELLENKRQTLTEDIMEVNTELENTESLLKSARDPDQHTAAALLVSILLRFFSFVAVNFELFSKFRKNVHHQLMEAIYRFFTLFGYYLSIILILTVICVLVGGLAAAFAAVSCSRYVKAFKHV